MNSRITPYVQSLLLINIALFIITYLFDEQYHIYHYLILHGIYSDSFAPYQLVTNIFMHGGFSHLLGNMIGLFVFGPLLEHYLGSKKFLILYFVCGIGAGLLYWGVNAYEVQEVAEEATAYFRSPNPDHFIQFIDQYDAGGYSSQLELINKFAENPQSELLIEATKKEVASVVWGVQNFGLLGASGAIFGILMAFALLFPNTELLLLFPPIPIKAKYLVGAYAAFEIFSLYENRPNDNVAHFVHIAGMIFAFILIKYWKTSRNSFY
jgi:membrane associated rhomboid family serine protease